MAKDTIGIDISKAGLDAFWHSRDEARSLPNSAEGLSQLRDWIGQREDVLIVFEDQTMGLTVPIIGDWNVTSASQACPSSRSIPGRPGALPRR